MPEGLRLVVFGDIHGHLVLLDEILAQLADQPRPPGTRDRYIFLGDYIDRGPDSRGVIDRVLALKTPPAECVTLIGNHEEMMMHFLFRGDFRYAEGWVVNGGAETMQSYGVKPPCDFQDIPDLERARRDLARAVPDSHRAFLDGLQSHHRAGTLFFAHAGVRPGVPLADQTREDMMWIRDKFMNSDADFGATVVHGHTATRRPQIRHNRIGIDTGSGKGGYLTAALFWGTDKAFLHAGSETGLDGSF